MKKILLLTLVFFLAIFAMGQSLSKKAGNSTFPQQSSKYFYDPSSKGERLDSTITENWDKNVPGYVKYMREISTYGVGTLVDITYLWDLTTIPNKWVNSTKTETTYNTGGDLTSMISYDWDKNTIPNVWVGDFKEVRTYVSGKLSVSNSYTWDAGQWVNLAKKEYTYDGTGKLISDISYMWVTAVWMNISKTEHAYDGSGNNNLSTVYSWDMINSEWAVSGKTESTFANGKKTLEITYNWDKTLPVPAWVNSGKTELAYDSNGNMTSMSSYTWDKAGSQWVGMMKIESVYTANDPTAITVYHWDKVVNPTTGWVNFSKTEQTASGSLPNNVKYVVMTGTDWDVDKWVNSNKDTYYYSDQSTSVFNKNSEDDITVYPNPAKEFIIFDLANISASAIAEIYDIQGKKVLEQKVSENKQISVSNLRKGLYFYKLHNNGTIRTGKLLIE